MNAGGVDKACKSNGPSLHIACGASEPQAVPRGQLAIPYSVRSAERRIVANGLVIRRYLPLTQA